MKKWIAYSLVLCLLFCFSACASSQETYSLNEQGLPVISANLRDKLNNVLNECRDDFLHTDQGLKTWGTAEALDAWYTALLAHVYTSDGHDYIRYYGNFDGYDIIFYDLHVQTMVYGAKVIVGGYVFDWGTDFAIVGHKNGVVHDLKELYQNGEISKTSLEKILDYHKLYEGIFEKIAEETHVNNNLT